MFKHTAAAQRMLWRGIHADAHEGLKSDIKRDPSLHWGKIASMPSVLIVMISLVKADVCQVPALSCHCTVLSCSQMRGTREMRPGRPTWDTGVTADIALHKIISNSRSTGALNLASKQLKEVWYKGILQQARRI